MSTNKTDLPIKTSDWMILKRIFSYTKPFKKIFYAAIFTTLALTFLGPVRPLLIEYTFDHYVADGDDSMLLTMAWVLVLVLVIESIFNFADTFVTNLLGQNIIKDLRLELYEHILHLKLKFYDNTPIGTLVTRAVSDIEVVASIFSAGLIVIISDLLKIIVVLIVMFYKNYELTLIVLIPIPLLFFATYLFKKAVQASFQDVRTQVARLNTFVQEHITGINIIQLFGREKAEHEKFEKINEEHREANVRAILAYSIFFPIVEILSSVSLGLLIWWAGKGFLSNTTTVGELIAFISFINMLFRPMRQLADRFNTLQMGMVASERVFNVLDTEDMIVDEGTENADLIQGNIEFKNVSFAYNNDDWVLKNISFDVKQGETIALVGATGAGKSSIINLLSRLYEYNTGEITVDGINVRDYKLASLRKNIGIVLQDVFLFSDSLANNISLNNPDITREQIVEAAKIVGADAFIQKLPNGYDFNSMERGGMLSVGQRQLIAFIRAYVYNPKILVLDEATSSIDTESEQLIQHAIDKLTENRTSIIIAHRLATIQKADKIIVIDKGQIAEMGSHQELLKLNGHYKRLFDLQFN
jgi:ATP-binding cassette, subfamily B, multidrug efflux pump